MSTIPELMEEDAGSALTVSFFDLAGDAWTPTTVEYRVDCLTTATAIKGLTGVGAASTVTLTLDSDDTEILGTDEEAELRQVSVMADRGLVTQTTQFFRFYVRNSFITT